MGSKRKKERSGRRPDPSRQRTDELRILNAIAETLNSAPDVQQAVERSLELVAELLGLRTGWVWLLDPDSGQFYSAAALNLPPYLQEPVRMVGGECLCNRLFLEGELTPTNVSLIDCSRLRPAVEANDTEATCGLQYHASIPIYFRDNALGIMNLTGPSWRQLAEEELRTLSTIGYQVGVAIERARLAEERTRLARAEERGRLAREIHDTLAQSLTAITLHLESAEHHLEADPARAQDRLRRAMDTARESLEEARRSVTDLRAAPLAGKSLAEALGALARRFTAETGVRVRPRVTGDRPLPFRAEAELFRVAEEALANVRAHARATDVDLILEVKARDVRLSIRDNGRGFDPENVPEGCYGLVGMRERAALIGGTVQVRSRPGGGTTVTAKARLPLEDAR